MLPFCRMSIHPKASKERWSVLSWIMFSGTSALNRAVAAVSCCAEKRDLLLEL